MTDPFNGFILCPLIKGNQQFVDNKKYQRQRKATAEKQHPVAVVISCSDSRVIPEVLFNELNLGQLFVVRVAGPALCQCDLDSVKYAIDNLNVRTIIIIGHMNCGAVTAVWDAKFHQKPSADAEEQTPGDVPTDYPCLYNYIYPSCVKIGNDKDLSIKMSIKLNVKNTGKYLVDHLHIDHHMIHLSYYNIVTGKIHFFCHH